MAQSHGSLSKLSQKAGTNVDGTMTSNIQHATSKLELTLPFAGNVERELLREGEKLSDMLAMPVKDALGRDLQLDYSQDIAQLRRQIEASRQRRQLCGQQMALQRLTLEQVTHIHAYEEDVRRARDWLQELYAVLLRCHSHVGCNIHEIQLQKDELQGFEETGRVSFSLLPLTWSGVAFLGNASD